METSEPTICLKLVVDPEKQRVLYAYAGADFVNFLIAIFSLPVASVTRLLSSDKGFGCKNLEKLCKSEFRGLELNPKVEFPVAAAKVPILPMSEVKQLTRKLFTCPWNHPNVTEDPNALCPICKQSMKVELNYISSPKDDDDDDDDYDHRSDSEEYSEDDKYFHFVVSNDLSVEALSISRCSDLLIQYKVKYIDDTVNMDVHMTLLQGLELLKASLAGKEVLTTVFLKNAGE